VVDMVTMAELYQALKSLGLPVAYGEFKTDPENPAPPPPFITYQLAYSSNVYADNLNYVDVENFQIELYTMKKDPAIEKMVQDKLKEIGLPYNKIETWLDTEKLFQVIYEVQLLGG